MADILELGKVKDKSSLNTGSLRRAYGNKKKKKSTKNFRICNTKYTAGK